MFLPNYYLTLSDRGWNRPDTQKSRRISYQKSWTYKPHLFWIKISLHHPNFLPLSLNLQIHQNAARKNHMDAMTNWYKINVSWKVRKMFKWAMLWLSTKMYQTVPLIPQLKKLSTYSHWLSILSFILWNTGAKKIINPHIKYFIHQKYPHPERQFLKGFHFPSFLYILSPNHNYPQQNINWSKNIPTTKNHLL